MTPLVEIIVLNWNGLADTLRCIVSLENQTYPNFRIVVVDNGSTDGSARALAALGDRVKVMGLTQNLGYTGGNNAAMREAFGRGADYVWLFNNDATAAPSALATLVAATERNPAIGLASPLVMESPDLGTMQHGCGMFDLVRPEYIHSEGARQAEDWQLRHPDQIAVHGTALLIRRTLYQAIGGLGDHFFAYWEDIDYSIRSAKAGYRNVVIDEAVIYHASKQPQTAPDSIKPHYYYFMSRNELLLWRKFCSRRTFIKSALWNLHRQLRQIARMPDYAAGIDAALAGLWHGLLGIGGPFDPAARMPEPLRTMFGQHPGFWLRLLGKTPTGTADESRH